MDGAIELEEEQDWDITINDGTNPKETTESTSTGDSAYMFVNNFMRGKFPCFDKAFP